MKPKRVILHCSDTPDSNDRFTAEDIDGWHRARGMSQIGYHEVIRRNGLREKGRPYNFQGAHCKGENSDSLGVCYVGRCQPTVDQIKTILEIYRDFKRMFGIGWSAWFGHYEFNSEKSCPGLPMPAVRLILANYDQGNFDLGYCDDQIRTFLQVCAVGESK